LPSTASSLELQAGSQRLSDATASRSVQVNKARAHPAVQCCTAQQEDQHPLAKLSAAALTQHPQSARSSMRPCHSTHLRPLIRASRRSLSGKLRAFLLISFSSRAAVCSSGCTTRLEEGKRWLSVLAGSTQMDVWAGWSVEGGGAAACLHARPP
jgi:hypothetical protein